VVGPTAGRWLIDVSSGVEPKQFVQGEWFVGIAALTGVVWIVLHDWGLTAWDGWATYLHSDGRPLLGRKLAGKSQRELEDLGLLSESTKST
jgi:hypothetical protein